MLVSFAWLLIAAVAAVVAALQVPTTRALCCVGTGDSVYRDMFYNGNVKLEPGAVVCRLSPSFVRFGTFQLPISRGGMQVWWPADTLVKAGQLAFALLIVWCLMRRQWHGVQGAL